MAHSLQLYIVYCIAISCGIATLILYHSHELFHVKKVRSVGSSIHSTKHQLMDNIKTEFELYHLLGRLMQTLLLIAEREIGIPMCSYATLAKQVICEPVFAPRAPSSQARVLQAFYSESAKSCD